MKKLYMFLFILILYTSFSFADVVILTNDMKVAGDVDDLGTQVRVVKTNGQTRMFKSDAVKKILYDKELYVELKAKKEKIADKPGERSKLALWAYQCGLYKESRELARIELKTNKEDETALNILGYKKVDDKWVSEQENKIKELVPKGYILALENIWALDYSKKDKWAVTKEDDKQHSKMNNPWYVASEHYLLKTNASADVAYELMTQFEEVYTQFNKIFKDDFDFNNKSSLMRVNVFATKAGYMGYAMRRWGRQAQGTTGFYFAQERNLTTFIQPSLKSQMMHEGTHQLMHHFLSLTSESQQASSTWVHEGLGRYYQNSKWEGSKVIKAGGQNDNDLNIINMSLKMGKYPSLKEVVNPAFTYQKFNQFFQHCYAFSSSYVEFMLTYDKGKYRKGFFKYLEFVKKNQASIENFEKAFEIKSIDDFQKEWSEWYTKTYVTKQEK